MAERYSNGKLRDCCYDSTHFEERRVIVRKSRIRLERNNETYDGREEENASWKIGPELREDNFRARYNNSCERGISWLVGTVTSLERRNKSSTLGCAAAKNITSPLRGRVKTQTRKQRGREKNGDGRHMGVGEHLWRRGISKAVARRVVREQCARTMRATTRSHSGKVGENNRNDDF